jgi:Holliday junction resolvasome RuvABC endonuclease subunit
MSDQVPLYGFGILQSGLLPETTYIHYNVVKKFKDEQAAKRYLKTVTKLKQVLQTSFSFYLRNEVGIERHCEFGDDAPSWIVTGRFSIDLPEHTRESVENIDWGKC